MNLRPLIMDAAAKAEIARVKAHAEANHYRPGDPIPGDNPAFVATLGTYRAVFTLTRHKRVLWRHLSVSVPSAKYPNPAAAFMIADAFGFTGWDVALHRSGAANRSGRAEGEADVTAKPRGLAALTEDQRREIASRGGANVPAEKRSFSQNRALASEAGRKGGRRVKPETRSFSINRALAVEAGRKGGRATRRGRESGEGGEAP